MNGAYRIVVDASRRLLSLVFSGVWTESIMDSFERDLNTERAKMEKAGLSPDWPCILIDITAFSVQPQGVAARIQDRVSRFHADRRIAFVAGEGQLLQMQARRIAAIETFHFFTDRIAALAWLREGQAVGAQAA